MPRKATFTVTVNLDPIPGWGNNADDFHRLIARHLDETIPHYNPTVTLNEVTEIAVTRTPEVWCSLLDVFILDADGWDRKNFAESWNTPITRKEFIERFQHCTIRCDETALALIAELRS